MMRHLASSRFSRGILSNRQLMPSSLSSKQPSVCLQRMPAVKQTRRTLVTEHIHSGMLFLKNGLDIPWWATFGISTFFVKVSMLPFVRISLIQARSFGKALPELNFLLQLLRERLKGYGQKKNLKEMYNTLSVFRKGVNACFQVHGVNLKKMFAAPLANFAVFLCFVYSVRDMILQRDKFDLTEGGMLWFENLTYKDKTFLLPLIAAGTTYTSLELAFSLSTTAATAAKKGIQTLTLFKDICQSILLLSMSMTLIQPAGIFCYWIPNSLFTILQTFALRTNVFRRLIRAPLIETGKSAANMTTASARTTSAIVKGVNKVSKSKGKDKDKKKK
jgi:YidC/Oxa1 family membrane protein insertase